MFEHCSRSSPCWSSAVQRSATSSGSSRWSSPSQGEILDGNVRRPSRKRTERITVIERGFSVPFSFLDYLHIIPYASGGVDLYLHVVVQLSTGRANLSLHSKQYLLCKFDQHTAREKDWSMACLSSWYHRLVRRPWWTTENFLSNRYVHSHLVCVWYSTIIKSLPFPGKSLRDTLVHTVVFV